MGDGPTGVAVGEGSVWAFNKENDTISRVDPEFGEVVETINADRSYSMAVGDGAIWVTAAAAPPPTTTTTPTTLTATEGTAFKADLVYIDPVRGFAPLLQVRTKRYGVVKVDLPEGVPAEVQDDLFARELVGGRARQIARDDRRSPWEFVSIVE